MVTQTPISVRLDNWVKWRIDQEVMKGSITRNKLINEGAKLYLFLQECRTLYRKQATLEDKKLVLVGFLKKYFPEVTDHEKILNCIYKSLEDYGPTRGTDRRI